MDWNRLIEFYKSRYGGINGALAGFLLTLSILLFGFFKVIFIAAGILAGYLIGNYIVHEKDYITAILDKLLPPGFRR